MLSRHFFSNGYTWQEYLEKISTKIKHGDLVFIVHILNQFPIMNNFWKFQENDNIL